ncbi:MAG TPA: redoxin domain-containing protein [Gemmatimonadaceae bacterium]|nr:redoxin domain-containing protein [Gemmatimonadaceae bacterium]
MTLHTLVRTAITIAHLALGLRAPAPALAQDGDGPAVGAVAPDFTARPVTKDGPMAEPITLSKLHGKTVVIAFFPKARTPGCTTQMTAYRDQYADVFNGGKDVVLLGVSTDSDADLTAWAKDAGFPFAFVSDHDGKIGKAYGALSALRFGFSKRLLFVIGPDGKVAYKATPFRQNSAEAYTELAQAIDRAATQ